jgi:hypothetical protein
LVCFAGRDGICRPLCNFSPPTAQPQFHFEGCAKAKWLRLQFLNSQVHDIDILLDSPFSRRFNMKKAIKSLRASIPSHRRLKQSEVPSTDDAGYVTPVAVIQQTLDVEGSDPVIPATTMEPASATVHSNPAAPIHVTGTSDESPTSLVENEQQIEDEIIHTSEEGNPSTISLIPIRRTTIRDQHSRHAGFDGRNSGISKELSVVREEKPACSPCSGI